VNHAWPHGDPNTVVREILAKPEYRASSAPPPQPSPIRQLIGEFFEWLGGIWQHAFHGIGGLAPGGQVAAVVLFVAAVLGIGYAAFMLASSFVSSRERNAQSVALAPVESPEALRAAALAAASAGDLARAIALLFRAALFALDASTLVAFDAARTPGEYRRVVHRVASQGAPAFDDLTSRFVRATFSGRQPQRADFDAAERAYTTFAPLLRAT
jgi:hypothetical protein